MGGQNIASETVIVTGGIGAGGDVADGLVGDIGGLGQIDIGARVVTVFQSIGESGEIVDAVPIAPFGGFVGFKGGLVAAVVNA